MVRNKRQMEIPGSTSELEVALDDLSDRLDDVERAKESIPPAKERLAEIMASIGKEKVFHRNRHFSVTETPASTKLRITKSK